MPGDKEGINHTFSRGRAALQRAVLMFFRKWDSSCADTREASGSDSIRHFCTRIQTEINHSGVKCERSSRIKIPGIMDIRMMHKESTSLTVCASEWKS